jgi:diguanylate cyclase (GGDEF)-like protein/PAS domain S-box-containing protein
MDARETHGFGSPAEPGTRTPVAAPAGRGWGLARLDTLLLVAAVAVLVADRIRAAVGRLDPTLEILLINSASLSLGLIAIALLLRAGHAAASRESGRGWRLLALAVTCNVMGALVWAIDGALPGGTSSCPVADAFYLSSYPLMLLGLLSFPARYLHHALHQAQVWLDVGIVLLSGGIVTWTTIIGPALQSSLGDPLAALLLVIYPALDLVILFGVGVALLRGTDADDRLALRLFVVSPILWMIADGLSTATSISGSYDSGGPVDFLYSLSAFFAVVAGFSRSRRGRTVDPATSRVADRAGSELLLVPLLPHVAAGIALVTLYLSGAGGHPGAEFVSAALAATLFAAIVVRQLLATRETIRLRSEEETLRAERRLAALVRNASDLILVLSADTTVRFASSGAGRLLGIPASELVGRRLTEYLDPESAAAAATVAGDLAPGAAASPAEWRVGRSDGQWRVLDVVATNLLSDPDVGGVLLNAHDVTERKDLEQQLSHRAFHDPLTGLANRALLQDRLELALARAARRTSPVALVMLDLDNFKMVNDSLGHLEGDRLLIEVAGRLRSCVRPHDTVARLGGDEFAVLLDDAPDAVDITLITERVTRALRRSMTLGGTDVTVTASIGVALSPDGSDRPETLVRDADSAMYAAKAGGKARTEVFEASMHDAAVRRLELESDLRRAVANDEIDVHFQPIVELDGGRITSVEALARWNHPTRGQIQPESFIPIAEETGLVIELGRNVLARACRAARAWSDAFGPDAPRMNVNLSPRQVADPNLLLHVRTVLDEVGLDPTLLVLEITELALMRDAESTAAQLRGLRELGIGLYVDDFGTGYSSLGYLGRFPITGIKMAKPFVDALRDLVGDEALARAIVSIGETLRLSVVAEGIEEQEQASRLQSLGCREGQGFLYARPATADEVSGLLGASARRRIAADRATGAGRARARARAPGTAAVRIASQA